MPSDCSFLLSVAFLQIRNAAPGSLGICTPPLSAHPMRACTMAFTRTPCLHHAASAHRRISNTHCGTRTSELRTNIKAPPATSCLRAAFSLTRHRGALASTWFSATPFHVPAMRYTLSMAHRTLPASFRFLTPRTANITPFSRATFRLPAQRRHGTKLLYVQLLCLALAYSMRKRGRIYFMLYCARSRYLRHLGFFTTDAIAANTPPVTHAAPVVWFTAVTLFTITAA